MRLILWAPSLLKRVPPFETTIEAMVSLALSRQSTKRFSSHYHTERALPLTRPVSLPDRNLPITAM